MTFVSQLGDELGAALRDEAYRQAEDVTGQLLTGITGELQRALADPRKRAFLAGYIGTAIVLASLTRGRMPFLPYWACCVAGGFGTRAAWQAAQDVHKIAETPGG